MLKAGWSGVRLNPRARGHGSLWRGPLGPGICEGGNTAEPPPPASTEPCLPPASPSAAVWALPPSCSPCQALRPSHLPSSSHTSLAPRLLPLPTSPRQMWTLVLPIDVAKTRRQTAAPGSKWDVGLCQHLQIVRRVGSVRSGGRQFHDWRHLRAVAGLDVRRNHDDLVPLGWGPLP